MSTQFQRALSAFGVYPESCMALSIGTDGLGDKARVLMLAFKSFMDDERDMNMFVAGGDPLATQRFTGITKQVYEGLAVKAQDLREILEARLDEYGVTNIVCHYSSRFDIREILRRQKLISNRFSFVDIGATHKALGQWTENLRQATNLIDLQAKVSRMRGKNFVKLAYLAEHYDVEPESPEESPYVPVRKARVVRDIFNNQLESELPF